MTRRRVAATVLLGVALGLSGIPGEYRWRPFDEPRESVNLFERFGVEPRYDHQHRPGVN